MELQDDYDHISNEIYYTTENIITESVQDEQINEGCTCEKECNLETKCTCLERSGALLIQEDKDEDLWNSYFIQESISNKPIYECNKNCKCLGLFCGNRLVQFGPRKNLQIVNTGEKGFGLMTTTPIKKGRFICEYAGEVISESEAKQRYQYNKTLNKMNYIFCVNEYFGEISYKMFIDPSIFGNIGRYINHSCEPNCLLYPIRINFLIPKLCIFAKRDIEKFEEITFDYGNENSDDETNRVYCLCKTKTCRKYLPYCPLI